MIAINEPSNKVNSTEVKVNYLEETLGNIAAKDLQKAQVFKKFGLDFCCGGKKTVSEACKDKGINPDVVVEELQNTNKQSFGPPLNYKEWEPGFLADYIVNIHHGYVKKNLPDLVMYANKVMKVHGKEHPELIEINDLVKEINKELSAHMEKEEKILFPYIKDLVAFSYKLKPQSTPQFATVQNPITMMESEHEMVGNHLAQIRAITNNYNLPAGACASYTFLYRLLEEFEEDLHLHVHLENNILFPKALEIEKTLIS